MFGLFKTYGLLRVHLQRIDPKPTYLFSYSLGNSKQHNEGLIGSHLLAVEK